MIKNIFAFTEPGANFPAYISINDRHGDDVAITIRGKARPYEMGPGFDPGQVAEIVLDEEQLRELWRALYIYLKKVK